MNRMSSYNRARNHNCNRCDIRLGRVLRLIGLIVFSVVLLTLTGCGRYFTAEIAGYVKDSENDEGIDGAVIRMYNAEPASPDAESFIVETASVTSNGNPGYFTFTEALETGAYRFNLSGWIYLHRLRSRSGTSVSMNR